MAFWVFLLSAILIFNLIHIHSDYTTMYFLHTNHLFLYLICIHSSPVYLDPLSFSHALLYCMWFFSKSFPQHSTFIFLLTCPSHFLVTKTFLCLPFCLSAIFCKSFGSSQQDSIICIQIYIYIFHPQLADS